MKRLTILFMLLTACGDEIVENSTPVETKLGTVFLLHETDCAFEKQQQRVLQQVVQAEINNKFHEAIAIAPWLSIGSEVEWFDGLLIEFRKAPFDCKKSGALWVPWMSRTSLVAGVGVQGCFIWYQNKIVTRCDGAAVGHEAAHAMLWSFNAPETCWKTVEHCPGTTFTCEPNACK